MKNQAAALYLENQLCFPLYVASRLTTKLYAPYLHAIDVTYPQYLVMLVLWQHEELSVSKIGKLLFLESNTLTPLLKRLEQKGLISRARSHSDERTVIISLTAKGVKLKDKASAIPEKIVTSFHDEAIRQEELRDFQQTLFKLLNILAKETTVQSA